MKYVSKFILAALCIGLIACNEAGTGASNSGGNSGNGDGNPGGPGGGPPQTLESRLEGSVLPKISAGGKHTCAVKDGGGVLCWGTQTSGILGNGIISVLNPKDHPISPLDDTDNPLTNILQVSSGNYHTCALKTDSTVLCWGRGNNGRLGHGSTNGSSYPAQVIASEGSTDVLSNIVQVSSGGSHTCALKDNGTIFCWGEGGGGRLGNGDTAETSHPVGVLEAENSTDLLSNIVQISSGDSYACALSDLGKVWCWGNGDDGQLGNGLEEEINSYPVQVIAEENSTEALSDIVQIDSGANHVCALNKRGSVFCWGKGTYGGLGDNQAGQLHKIAYPVEVLESADTPLESVKQIAMGNSFSCALKNNGTVTCWGFSGYGTIGNGGNSDSLVASTLVVANSDASETLNGITQITAGYEHACALKNDGRLFCWGNASQGRLGNDTINPSAKFAVPVIDADGSTTPLYLGVFFESYYKKDDLFKLEATKVSTTGRYPHEIQIDAVADDTQSVIFYSDYACSRRIDEGLEGDSIALPGSVERVYFKQGDGECSRSFLTYGFDRIPPEKPVGDLPTATIRKGSGSRLQVSNLEEGHTFIAYSDSSCQTPIGDERTSSGNPISFAIEAEDQDFTRYGRSFDQNGNPSACASLRNILVLDQKITATGRISVGNQHACFLKEDSTVLCWGLGDRGQLGNGSSSTNYQKDHPIYVRDVDNASGSKLSGIVQISTGTSYNCALNSTGEVFCWGYGDSGRLGNDGTSNENHPQEVIDGDGSTTALTGITQIEAGSAHACALNSSGNVLCWGKAEYGRLGNDDSTNNKDHPVTVIDGDGSSTALTGIVQISSGADHNCALNSSGEVYCWGNNSYGKLGQNNSGSTTSKDHPVKVKSVDGTSYLTNITQVVAGGEQTCALNSSGEVLCWGSIRNGRLGNGETATLLKDLESLPVYALSETAGSTARLSGVIQISSWSGHTCALKQDSTVVCWGQGTSGKLGNDTTSDSNRPTFVVAKNGEPNSKLTGVIEIMAGGAFTCALKSDGRIVCWGNGFYGKLGNNGTSNKDHPVFVVARDGTSTPFESGPPILNAQVCETNAGVETCTAVAGFPTAPADFESSGTGDSVSLDIHDTDIIAISEYSFYKDEFCSQPFSTVLTGNTASLSPFEELVETSIYFKRGVRSLCYDSGLAYTKLGGIFPLRRSKLALGTAHSCALSDDGTVKCWGRNNNKQLGNDGSGSTKDHPVTVIDGDGSSTALSGIVQIATGGSHSCGLNSNGNVHCWGIGATGNLGNDGTSTSDHPVLVVDGDGSSTALGGIVQVSSVAAHTCAVNSSGNVYCWGYGTFRQLGDGGSSDSDHPVAVIDGSGSTTPLGSIAQVAAGEFHTCALDLSGEVWCWGQETFGALGNNLGSFNTFSGNSFKSYPVKVVAGDGETNALSNIVQITAGDQVTCALSDEGEVYCWGEGGDGRLGDGTNTDRSYPAKVIAGSGETDPLSNIVQIAAYDDHVCALSESGEVYCWGDNTDGQLGNDQSGASNDKNYPVKVVDGDGSSTALAGISSIAVGADHSCAIKNDGELLCWGNEQYGRLGNNVATDTTKDHPVTVHSADGVTTALDLGTPTYSSYICLTRNGSLVCETNQGWGQRGVLPRAKRPRGIAMEIDSRLAVLRSE